MRSFLIIKFWQFVFFGFISFSISPLASAQTDASVTARKIELEEHRARIYSKSQEEAIAAVEVGLNSGDPELRSMTLEAALNNDDIRVQTVAFRWLFSERKRIPFQILKPIEGDDGSNYAYTIWRGFVLDEFEFDKNTDEIRINKSYYQGGQIVRGGFQLEYSWKPDRKEGYRCSILAEVDKVAFKDKKIQLKGIIDCIYPSLKGHPAKGDEDGSVGFIISLP